MLAVFCVVSLHLYACSMNTYTYSIASLPGPWLAFHHLRYGTTFVQNVWNEAIFMLLHYVCTSQPDTCAITEGGGRYCDNGSSLD